MNPATPSPAGTSGSGSGDAGSGDAGSGDAGLGDAASSRSGSGDAASSPTPPNQRARAILLDPDDRVLLILVHNDGAITNPFQEVPDEFWITPGGGAEPGETPEQNLRREVAEETGITDLIVGPELWLRTVALAWHGVPTIFEERYLATRTRNATCTFDHIEPEERKVFRGSRWWTLAELTANAAASAPLHHTIVPPNLVELVVAAIGSRRADGPTGTITDPRPSPPRPDTPAAT